MFRIRLFITLSILTFMLFITGCITTPVCITSSNTPMVGKTVQENLGTTRGSDSAISILGLWMLGRPDTGAAIDEAITEKNADALINVQCYQEKSYYFLFSLTTVIVEGEAVQFTPEEVANGSKKSR